MNDVQESASRAGGERSAPPRHPPDPTAPPQRLCDLCRGPVLERHCKVICLNCGYQRDCSDP